MNSPRQALLLDTCALIWLVNGDPLDQDAIATIEDAARTNGLFVSPISAWEVGLLSRPYSSRTVSFNPNPRAWFAEAVKRAHLRPAALTPDIAIAASHLPGDVHDDPADRIIIATARHRSIPVVTRDSKIIAYAQSGHVGVVPC